MVRTQIQLAAEQFDRLEAAAARRGVSMAELIRQSVDAVLAGEPPASPDLLYERAAGVSGRFRSGSTDTAEHHDQALAKAYAK